MCTLRLLLDGIWQDRSPQVQERRGRLFDQVQLKHELLLPVARGLLHLDKHSRLSVVGLRTHLLSVQRTVVAPDRMFDLNALTRTLTQPQGAHDVLAEAFALAQQHPAAGIEQVQHFIRQHLPILKTPPADMCKTLLQLASQEPAGSRLLHQAPQPAARGHRVGQQAARPAAVCHGDLRALFVCECCGSLARRQVHRLGVARQDIEGSGDRYGSGEVHPDRPIARVRVFQCFSSLSLLILAFFPHCLC